MTQLAIDVRRATATDAAPLSGFAASVFPLGGRPGANPAHLAAYIATELTPHRFREFIADENIVLLIAESGGQIAGYAALMRDCGNSQIQAKFPAELRKLYVDPRYHGSGVADALMREVLSATEPPCDAIWLSVYSENARAIAFYTRWGFRLAGEQDFLVGEDRQKDFLMRRDA